MYNYFNSLRCPVRISEPSTATDLFYALNYITVSSSLQASLIGSYVLSL